jgi:hypothetical protein
MSPHAQQSFVNDLVAMARAFEELPLVREELRDTQARLDAALSTVQRLELKLIDHKNEITDLIYQVSAMEASRDDAELRFLEADDRTEKALAFVRSTFGNAGALIQALDPKPEPKVESESPLPEAGTFTALSGEDGVAPDHGQSSEPVPTVEPMPKGQSEPDPTGQAGQPIAEKIAEVLPSETNVVSGPYVGKRYHDHQFYVSLHGWLEGGGTEEDYTWRPSAQMIG